MKALIAELERATEGSRELDAEIAMFLYPWLATYRNDPERGAGHWISDKDGPVYASNYTTSLDAALTLVPEGSYIRMTIGRDKKAWVWVECAEDEKVAYAIPALALCIAALRTRQAMKDAA